MIGRLKGTLLHKQAPFLLIDVGGVGYEVEAPMSTIYDLPEVGHTVTLLTHLVVREDAHLLYGFLNRIERDTFRQLIRISGIGPRIALAILSGLSPDELALAIQQEDSACLARTPGIGKKTAERLILELRGKLEPGNTSTTPSSSAASGTRSDIIATLLALGYNDKEAALATKTLPADISVNDGIRQALKHLAKPG